MINRFHQPRRRSRAWTAILAPPAVATAAVVGAASAFAQFEPTAATAAVDSAIPTASLWDTIVAGGPLMIPIGVCSFLLLLVTLERLISLRWARVVPRLFVERLLLQIGEGALDRREALDACEENSSLTAEVFAAALRKWGKPAVEVEQAVLDEGERAANRLRRFLRMINGVATVSPLLGLLGTVSGMIQAFNDIAASSAMGRAELLAGGIGTALVTTAAGLCIAIPALTLYLYFISRVDALVTEIDRLGQELVQLISAEGLEDRRNRPPRPSKAKKPAA